EPTRSADPSLTRVAASPAEDSRAVVPGARVTVPPPPRTPPVHSSVYGPAQRGEDATDPNPPGPPMVRCEAVYKLPPFSESASSVESAASHREELASMFSPAWLWTL